MGLIVEKGKLKTIRSDIDISQQELATLLNVSSSTIERWEREGAKESNSASWKNLYYLLNICESKLVLNHLKTLLDQQNIFVAQSFLFGLGPILSVLKLESGGSHFVRDIICEYEEIIETNH